jgi:hypothetical protein
MDIQTQGLLFFASFFIVLPPIIIFLFRKIKLTDKINKSKNFKIIFSGSILLILAFGFFLYNSDGNKGEGVHHDITDHRLTSSSSFTPKSKKSITPSQANRLAEDYIDDNGVLHGTMGLDFYQNLSDPDNGIFTFYGSVCYGSSKDNCQYDNVYISTKDNGDSWSVSF